ncbi:MAG: response regulator [Gammaproteobacteria bacterium]
MDQKRNIDRLEATSTITVMLVDDHALVRAALRHLLRDAKGIKIVAEASSGEEAIRVIREVNEVNPDVILMDFDMPGISGLEATQRLHKSLPETKVIIVSSYTHEVIAFRLLEEGAKGFVAKEASPEEIVKAIKTVKEGNQYISEELAARLASVNVDDPNRGVFNSLSNKELQMVFMIVKGFRTKEISEKLHLSAKTVSAYRSSLCNKLGVDNEVELILLAMKHRLVDVEKI